MNRNHIFCIGAVALLIIVFIIYKTKAHTSSPNCGCGCREGMTPFLSPSLRYQFGQDGKKEGLGSAIKMAQLNNLKAKAMEEANKVKSAVMQHKTPTSGSEQFVKLVPQKETEEQMKTKEGIQYASRGPHPHNPIQQGFDVMFTKPVPRNSPYIGEL